MSQTILKEMLRQAQGMCAENFICKQCRFYKGNLICEKGIFIAFEGANTLSCIFYIQGRKCSQSGRIS